VTDEECQFLFVLSTSGLLHDTVLTHPSKSDEVGSNGEPHPWDTSIQERRERVGIGKVRRDVAGIGGGGRKSGNEFGGILLCRCMGSGVRPVGMVGADNSLMG